MQLGPVPNPLRATNPLLLLANPNGIATLHAPLIYFGASVQLYFPKNTRSCTEPPFYFLKKQSLSLRVIKWLVQLSLRVAPANYFACLCSQ